ncbi:MAG: globin domain-containing protein, partial [Gammaproteobacteria bacterium]|nr:globin domain-containing protein [Gammaproteobacteria bacterium]
MTSGDGKLGFDPLAWMKGDAQTNEHPLGLNVAALRTSFEAVAPRGEELVARFYSELFRRYPDVKPMFANTTPEKQKQKLLAALKLVVANLENVEVLASTLTELGRRHAGYGAEPGHYGAVASTLIDVMKEIAGDAWTDEFQLAWSKALEVIAKVMLDAYPTQEEAQTPAAAHPLGLNVAALKQSFAALTPWAGDVVEKFYTDLFKQFPGVQPLFAGTTQAEQEKKLLAALKLVINNLEDVDSLARALTALGGKHQGYGALPEHYPAVAQTLIGAMQEFAGEVWTAEVATAWEDALNVVAKVMLDAYVTQPEADEPAADNALDQIEAELANNTAHNAAVVSQQPDVAPTPEPHPLGLDVISLETSFNALAPHADAMVEQFYEELFKQYPQVQPLFANTSRKKQEAKLLAALKLVVNNLRKPDVLGKALTDLGARHQSYGAVAAHYGAVAGVLLGVMKEFAGALWTPVVHDAWEKALNVIAEVMLGAYTEQEEKTMAASKEAISGLGNVTLMDDMDMLKDMLEFVPVNVMIADENENIVYINKRAKDVLLAVESDLAKYLPGFKVADVLGGSIHRYHKDPNAIKQILNNLRPGD